jgi:hypothetical protein
LLISGLLQHEQGLRCDLSRDEGVPDSINLLDGDNNSMAEHTPFLAGNFAEYYSRG